MSGLALVSNRADGAQPGLSSGEVTAVTYRNLHRALCTAAAPRLLYANRQHLLNAGETLPADTIRLKACFETAQGALLPVLFNGAGEVALAPGEEALSDPIPAFLPQGSTFFVRSRPMVAAPGGRWPIAGGSNPGTPAGGGHASGDAVDAPADRFTQAAVGFGPAMILGRANAPPPATAVIMGDSIAYGSGDVLDAAGDYGFLARFLTAASVPHFKLATPGQALAHFLGRSDAEAVTRTRFHRAYLDRARPSHAVLCMANNDIHNPGIPLPMVQRNFLRWCDWLEGMGCAVCCTTLGPRSAGDWTTLAGQVEASPALNARRRDFNAWLALRPHANIREVWDVASLLCDASSPGRWRVEGGAWTRDGTHPSALAHRAVAEALLASGAGF